VILATDDTKLVSRRRAPLYALYVANFISQIGDVLTLLAIPWFVLQTTGSITQTGVAAFFSTAAVAVSALFGSNLVDRVGFRRASVLSDVVSVVTVALIPLFYYTIGLPFWVLLLLVFLAGVFTTPGGTARAAMVPDLTLLAQVRMERATAMTDGVVRIARFVGAPLAGILIAVIGASNLLWVDASTFAVSALLIGTLVPSRVPVAPVPGSTAADSPEAAEHAPASGSARRYLAELREGLGFIWRDSVLLSMVITVMVTNLLDAGMGSVLTPAYIKQVFGNAVVQGTIIAVFGGTAFIGTLVFGTIGHRLPRRLTLGIGFTLAGAPRFWALALFPIVPVLVVVYAIGGFGIGPVNPLLDTIEYERIPVSLRARVFGTISAGATVGIPLGGLLSAALASWIGLQGSLLLFGAIYFLATTSLIVNPALRGMEKPTSA
jgi:MFS family permease